ncbi:GNAT family N-acetyltransferase [Acutalibacter intestini]|uniref:GNAT family N-acetyltransferase n=1 Tax=Acutalibacter intestini TaxID=3093659 RepID=UPI002AC8C35C|nr:GNAT family N-acetyltransferase [Acutalibacter sp. M00204]
MLETKDLILDKGRQEDWQAMYSNVWSRPESFRYMLPQLSLNEAEAKERMRRTIEFQKSHDTYIVYLRSTHQAIGFAGVEQVGPDTWQEVGICLGPDFVGRGFGKQIVQCLLAYAKRLGAREFLYSTWEENTASIALAKAAGFTLVSQEPMTRPHDGQAYTLLKFKLAL